MTTAMRVPLIILAVTKGVTDSLPETRFGGIRAGVVRVSDDKVLHGGAASDAVDASGR